MPNAKIFDIMAAELNELAGYIEREELLPNHTPPYPTWWFDSAAREWRNMRGTTWLDKLTPAARARFEEVTR